MAGIVRIGNKVITPSKALFSVVRAIPSPFVVQLDRNLAELAYSRCEWRLMCDRSWNAPRELRQLQHALFGLVLVSDPFFWLENG